MKKLLVSIFLILALCNAYNLQAQTLKKYAQQRKQELLEKQRVEQKKYDALCKDCTLEKCKEYLSLYPNGKYAKEVSNRIADFDAWDRAKAANTIDSYQSYIQNSQYKFFEHNAKESITELESIKEWEQIKDTNSPVALLAFMNKYPNSSCLDKAKRKFHEFKGVEYYGEGKLVEAFKEFTEAGGKYNLDSSNRRMYDECLEYSEYQTLKTSTDKAQLQAFLAKYPSSPYYNDISNRIAIQKAKDLNMSSGEYSFNGALAYAKDTSTRAIVNAYIDDCKKSYAHYKRMSRRNRIKANGGYIQFGIEPMDIGLNLMKSDRWMNIGYYNVGISVKIGNFKAPVQFEIGAKPGVIVWKFNDDDYYDDNGDGTEFHLPIYARLKINMFNAGRKCKFYIAGLGFYNAVRDEYLENEFSFGGGFGFAWHHWDWLMIYYKQGIKDNIDLDDKFLGTSLVYYF